MSDSLEPPAKRARLEGDAPIYGTSATALDAPGSPIDDEEDDFYDTTPVINPSAQPTVYGASSMFAAAAPAPAPFQLPGLGSMSEAPVAQQPSIPQDSAIVKDEAPEDGELSDDEEAFYDDADAQASIPVQQSAANESQAQDQAPQYDGYTVTGTPEDTDGELDAALTAAIDAQNEIDQSTKNAAPDGAAFDSKAEFLRAAEANKGDKNAEWELDSDASDTDTSSDSSSDDSSDEEGSDEGELLDPAEQVRLLMAEAADDPNLSGPVKVKTLNEQDEKYEKPDITVTENMKISELGNVESVVGNLVVVKAKRSGNDEVLESGSALCLQDRTVIGKVSEQIGRVEEPRYSFGFNDAEELTNLGIQKDTPIYYVEEHSTWVETEPIRLQKHTDASNLHDEEAHDVEFSDDEKEAEYKRAQKEKKKRARAGPDDEQAVMNIPTGPRLHVDAPAPPVYRPMEYQGGGLKYSDDDDDDMGMYRPLARPDHFEQIVGQGAPLEDRSHVRRGMGRGRGAWGDRGRGFRGRGAGGRGDFGGGRGDRGGYGGGRGDFAGGRGDRQGQRGDRGGQGNNRGGSDRGGRGGKNQNQNQNQNQSDRGRQQDQFNDRNHDRQQNNQQRNGYQNQRSATSASPARQQQDRGHSYGHQDRGQSQQSSNQQSPPAKNKNRKQRQREKRERERQENQQQQRQQHNHNQQQTPKQQHASPAPSAPINANAYANNSSAGWPVPFSGPSQPGVPYAAAPPPPPSVAAASYAPQPAYTPQPQMPIQPPQQQNQAANYAAWQAWFQLVQSMSGQQPQQPQMQAPAPAPPPPQPQPQAQYAYPYQQYAQQPAAPAQSQQQQQGNAQAQSLQDILRALSGGGAPQ